MNQIYFKINRNYYHTSIDYDLNKLQSWFDIINDIGVHTDYFTVVTKYKYRMSFKNKKSHYIVDPEINWSYHLFFLYNHPTQQLYNQIPTKIKDNRHFKYLYKREFKKIRPLEQSKFINPNEIKDLVKQPRNYFKYL